MERKEGVSPELDALSCNLMGQVFDLLADGKEVPVLLAVQDSQGHMVSYQFSDDGIEACIEGAHTCVQNLKRSKGDKRAGIGVPQRYALVCEGAVADDKGAYQDAILLEFGEVGYHTYSAYSLYKGRGDVFQWTDPAPAGELDDLL